MSQRHYRACNLCEAICGLVIETDGEQIRSIKGDTGDPLSRGHICPKAVALQDIQEDPDRLRRPVKRLEGPDGKPRWEEISWEEALDTTARRLAEIRKRDGADAIGAYQGNPSVHNYGLLTHPDNLFRHIVGHNRFSATSVDQLPHHLASLWLFGHKFLLPIPDIDRTDYFLMLGANPVASNGSIWTVPDVKKRLEAIKERGGKLVVIDPRRTETATLASEHHFITPGTDALFLLAVLNTIFAEDLARPRLLAAFTAGLEDVARDIAPFTAEVAAPHTGIGAADTRRIARELAQAEAAICYGRTGVSTQTYGALNQWLIQVINVATGNLDRPGGSMFTLPAVDQVSNVHPGGFARYRSRVRGLPEFDRELPVVVMAEEITTPGDGQIRALITVAGNPVLSTPNGRQLDEALEELEFMVSVDPYLNETTRHADIILPPTSPLEHDHYDLAFHIIAIRNTARFNEAVVAPPPGSLHDWEIFGELGNRVAALLGLDTEPVQPPWALVDAGLQGGPYREQGLSLAKLREHPSGLDLGPMKPQLPGRLRTPDQLIHCNTPEPLADLERLRLEFSQPRGDQLKLIGRRDIRSNNSWMHNYPRLVKGKDRCTLLMHPEDMQCRGIEDASEVTLTSRVGSVRVSVESSLEVMPGVVSLPHGYGHDRDGIRVRVAAEHAGVSCNDVTDESMLDALSGNAVLNGVPVTVAAV